MDFAPSVLTDYAILHSHLTNFATERADEFCPERADQLYNFTFAPERDDELCT